MKCNKKKDWNYTINIVWLWWDLYRMQFIFNIQVLQKLMFKIAPQIQFVPQQIADSL